MDFWLLQYKNNCICFLKIELSLAPFKDSSKIAILHSDLFKANSKFNNRRKVGSRERQEQMESLPSV